MFSLFCGNIWHPWKRERGEGRKGWKFDGVALIVTTVQVPVELGEWIIVLALNLMLGYAFVWWRTSHMILVGWGAGGHSNIHQHLEPIWPAEIHELLFFTRVPSKAHRLFKGNLTRIGYDGATWVGAEFNLLVRLTRAVHSLVGRLAGGEAIQTQHIV